MVFGIMKNRLLAEEISKKTSDAYSFDRYAPGAWRACCFMLLQEGYTAENVEAIMRSKWTRWAADASKNAYGHITSGDLRRFMENPKNNANRQAVEQLTAGLL